MMGWFRRKSGHTKRAPIRRRQLAIGLVLLTIVIASGIYLSSDRFAERMRRKVIATLEDVTGGRVELHSFRWNLSRLEFEARDLTIHGLEPAGQIPYAHVDHLLVRLKI